VGSIIYIELLLRLYYNNTLEESIKQIANLFNKIELKNYERIFNQESFRTPQEDILSGGYVVHTLEAAIWCLGNTSYLI